MTTLPIELWPISASTGWGVFGLGLAMGLARQGRTVCLPPSDPQGIPPTLKPTLEHMLRNYRSAEDPEPRIALLPYGLHWPKYIDRPNRIQVLIYMAEDTTLPDHAIETIKRYPLVLAPSRWAQAQLAKHDIPSTLIHQGYNESLFFPAPRQRPADGPFYVFSGGKLEFRKSADVVIESFRRFRETTEGKDAVLVTAWTNIWPQTMAGIWESGYVKGIPVTRNGIQDFASWLEVNGVPREATIDLGMISQADMAQAIRECDVALFPNRCECATNLLLPETMACGVPCIVGDWTGQADVCAVSGCIPLRKHSPVTLPCPIYTGYEGWGEPDVDECVSQLQRLAQGPTVRAALGLQVAKDAERWFGWNGRSKAIHDILTTLE